MRDRINAGRKKQEKKEGKKYYDAIFNDLLKSVDQAFTELSEAVKKAE